MPNTSAFYSSLLPKRDDIVLQLPNQMAKARTAIWTFSGVSQSQYWLMKLRVKYTPNDSTNSNTNSTVKATVLRSPEPFFIGSSFLLLFTGGESKGAGHRSRLTCYQGLSPYHLLLYHKKQKNTNF